jgi:hypothetical protein
LVKEATTASPLLALTSRAISLCFAIVDNWFAAKIYVGKLL